MISGTISYFSGDSLRVENESKVSFETLVFHNVNFLSYDRSFEVAVVIFSDGLWRLEFKLFGLSNKSERDRIFSHQCELVIFKNSKKFRGTPENLSLHTSAPWHTVWEQLM